MSTSQRLAAAPWFIAGCLAVSAPARADDTPPPTWISGINLSAQIQAGIVGNPAAPKLNFGQLLTDHPNQVLLNQILLTAQRAIDPKQTGWDVGFKLQGMYGSDARYTHFLGEFNYTLDTRNQFDIVEANITVHMPVLTAGGIDLKLGQYSSPLGYETIDPSTNPFYTHSYIFNFGVPFGHTGGLAIAHVTPMLDVYVGLDTGVNTTLGKGGDNNGALAGIVGFNLTLLDGKLTVLALSHMGPENPTATVPNADAFMRYLNDVVITYKATKKLGFVTELNFIRDDFFQASGGGVAQYVSYALNDLVTLNARAEVWADGKGFFVAAFPGNFDFVNSELGKPATVISAPKPTTYGALTLGATFKPSLPAPVSGLLIRPEIRYDRSLNGTTPFNSGRDRRSLTIATDFVLTF